MFLLQKFIELIGPTQGQLTVLRLTELLERGERLPRPEKCPYEVRLPLLPLSHCPSYRAVDRALTTAPFFLPQIYVLMKNCWEAEASFRPTFQNLIPILKTAHEKYWGQASSVFNVC